MKQMKRKLGILLFGIMLVFAFSIPVMAKNVAEKKEVSATAQKVEHVIENQNTRLLNNNVPAGLANSIEDNIVEMGKYSSDTRYLTGVAPRENDVITQGERLYIKFYARDTWKYYYTKPIVSVFNANSDIVYISEQNMVSLSGQDTYSGYISWNTATAKPGKYSVYIVNAPCYSDGTLLSDWASFDCLYINTKFKLAAKPVHKHTYGKWKTVKSATVFATGKKVCSCKSCGSKKTQTIPKLKPTIKLSATKKTIGRNKSYTLSITNLAKGDSIKSIKSSKTTIATIKKVKTNQYKIIGKKKGKSTITVVLKSGKKATCTITVK